MIDNPRAKFVRLCIIVTAIYITQPVATIQMDIDTDGTVELVESIENKDMQVAPIEGGQRVLIFGLNQDIIEGHILNVDGEVRGVSNVHAADGDAQEVEVEVKWVASPENFRIKE